MYIEFKIKIIIFYLFRKYILNLKLGQYFILYELS